MDCQCKRQCNCMKCELKRYIQKTIKEQMVVPKDGDSAYQVALNNEYIGTEQEWLTSLCGTNGLDGKGVPTVYHFVVSESGLGNIMHVGKNIDYSLKKCKNWFMGNV